MTHCHRGHEFTPENTKIRKSNGQRLCVLCRRLQSKIHSKKARIRGLKQDTNKVRARRLKCLYGLSQGEYDRLFILQNGTCAICERPEFGNLHVDHNHHTGEVRGLLCGLCNRGLGLFKDNTTFLNNAVKYLTKD